MHILYPREKEYKPYVVLYKNFMHTYVYVCMYIPTNLNTAFATHCLIYVAIFSSFGWFFFSCFKSNTSDYFCTSLYSIERLTDWLYECRQFHSLSINIRSVNVWTAYNLVRARFEFRQRRLPVTTIVYFTLTLRNK